MENNTNTQDEGIKVYTHSKDNVTFANINIEDMRAVIAKADAANAANPELGLNQIAIPFFLRTGAGMANLHTMEAVAASLGSSRAFWSAGRVEVRAFVPKETTGLKV